MIINMDCRTGMATLPANSVDAIVTDPPYGLSKQPNMREVLTHWLNGDEYSPTCGGFMGKKWDSFVPGPLVWEQALRVLKPGGYLVAFAGSRTVDLMATSLRLGGFEVVDMLHWLYALGMPKSMAIDKAIDKAAGAERSKDPVTAAAAAWEGWGTSLKPCHEPIILCRKPLEGTYANNVQKHGVGALNIDGCRVGSSGGTRHEPTGEGRKTGQVFGTYGASKMMHIEGLGRFPGNVLHDGCLPEPMDRYFYSTKATKADREAGLDGKNPHPTVKPTKLMRWLCRLVTPPGGIILDPFTGSGSTGRGAVLEGFQFIGFELDPQYVETARARVDDAIRSC
jgi:site-specific DNA-methyltransferase (adenine-specific)